MRIYISGPMTGLPNLNKDKFNEMERMIKELGHEVINPAKLELPLSCSHDDYLSIDIPLVSLSDAICLLEGWENSEGAQEEYTHACHIGKEVVSEKEVRVCAAMVGKLKSHYEAVDGGYSVRDITEVILNTNMLRIMEVLRRNET